MAADAPWLSLGLLSLIIAGGAGTGGGILELLDDPATEELADDTPDKSERLFLGFYFMLQLLSQQKIIFLNKFLLNLHYLISLATLFFNSEYIMLCFQK